MSNMNVSAKISTITAMLHNNGSEPMEALILATSLLDSVKSIGGEYFGLDELFDTMEDAIHNCIVTVTDTQMGDKTTQLTGVSLEGWFDKLVHADLLTTEGALGSKFIELDAVKEKSHARPASEGVVERRKPVMPGKPALQSKLLKDAINVLQKSEFNVDEWIMKLAARVYTPEFSVRCDTQYVLDGCNVMIANGNEATVAEFFADRRGRLNQGDCHGANGQAGDMERALMNLHGVDCNYDIEKAKVIVKAEIADMHKGDFETLYAMVKKEGATVFVQAVLMEVEAVKCVKKPWSFVKACRILAMLDKGQRPYIGMAFGLDAKCSGPQLGALMIGDQEIAAACGFTYKTVADAYERCCALFADIGVTITREEIKTAYMGVFYGQKWKTFADLNMYGTGPKQHKPELLPLVMSIPVKALRDDETELDAQAKMFVNTIEKSFGMMAALRQSVIKAHGEWIKGDWVQHTSMPTTYQMPDGLTIAMKKYVKVDIMNRCMNIVDIKPMDVSIELNGATEVFLKYQLNTKEHDLMDYARSGFVNMIQGTDALVARLIITHLDRLGAQHVISVHDCFRVNINDMISGLLHEAIEATYHDLFSNKKDEGKGYLILGTDILGLYFKGVREVGLGRDLRVSQFAFNVRTKSYVRKISQRGFPVEAMIGDLVNHLEETGSTYFFDK